MEAKGCVRASRLPRETLPLRHPAAVGPVPQQTPGWLRARAGRKENRGLQGSAGRSAALSPAPVCSKIRAEPKKKKPKAAPRSGFGWVLRVGDFPAW